MALVYTIDHVRSRKDLGGTVVVLTLDGSYAAGGYPLTNSGLGMLDTPDTIDMQYQHATATSDFFPVFDKANHRIKIFKTGAVVGTTLAECVAGDITSGHSIRCVVKGRPIL